MTSIAAALAAHREQGTYRSLRTQGPRIDFSSNDYLGLAQSSRIRAQLLRELENGCPLGATGSRLLSGQTPYHERVEDFLARTFSMPSALILSSGYLANQGVLSTLASLGAHFFSDALNHASLIDGMRILKCDKSVFQHNDVDHLETLLELSASPVKVIVTESVFSMDGDLAPLVEIAELARRFGAWLIVDEAHATGIFGARGLGCLDGANIETERLISIHTGGKALGGQGAFVLSSREFRELLINRARSFVFSTALAPLSTLQLEFALCDVLENPERGARLLSKAAWLRKQFEHRTLASCSQILPVVLGSNALAVECAEYLQNRELDVRAIRSPTVPAGSERLRITIKSEHSDADLRTLSTALGEVLR